MRLLWRIVKTIFSSLFLAVVVLVGAPVAFGVTVLAGLIFLPLPATIPIPKPNPSILPTVIYDRYGHQIATLAAVRPQRAGDRGGDPAGAQRGGHRRRGPQLLPSRRRRPARHPAGPVRRHPPQRAPAGRVDHHPAVREAGVHQPAAHAGAQGPGGHPGQPARPRGQQERDPLPLPDGRLLRRRQLRGRRRRRELLPRAGQRPQRVAGRHPGRASSRPPAPGLPARTSPPPR